MHTHNVARASAMGCARDMSNSEFVDIFSAHALSVKTVNLAFTDDRVDGMEPAPRSYWSETVPWASPEASGTIGRDSYGHRLSVRYICRNCMQKW